MPGVPQDFLMSGEACYDYQLDTYHLAYFRSASKTYLPLSRYMQPMAQLMTAVTGFNDRNMINQCLMYRFIISYEPFNFKGSLEDFPQTVTYGKQMDALRTAYRKWFWDGVYQHHDDALAKSAGGSPWETYSVYKASDGSLGLVVVNYENDDAAVNVTVEGNAASYQYRLVDGEQWKAADTGLLLPPYSAAIVVPC
ncbi:hypothetical protein AGMMS49992_27660 [Clostridia bacterium]|nr:hypothetical protein AGMMS49992_27660 [Clostridia bacterium]